MFADTIWEKVPMTSGPRLRACTVSPQSATGRADAVLSQKRPSQSAANEEHIEKKVPLDGVGTEQGRIGCSE